MQGMLPGMWTAGTDPVTPDTLEDATWLTFGVTDTPQPPNLTQLPVVTAGLELGALLGEGSTGTVHLAYHAVLEREVAVKRLKSGSPERAMPRLLQEGRTMGSLEHPNIIPVHAIGVDHDGTPALVMKRVEGRSWRVGEDGLEADIAVLIAVSSALLHAHQNGTVHRDLKPGNLLIRQRPNRAGEPIGELLAARECYLKIDNPFTREQVARIAQDIAELERDNADLVAELAAGELGTKPLKITHFK